MQPLNILQDSFSRIANSTDDNVLESTKVLHNEMGMLLVDMNYHLEIGQKRINQSEHELARLEELSIQKQQLTYTFQDQESKRKEDLEKHQATTQRITFLKESIARMEAELQTLLPQEASLSKQIQQTQNERFQLYSQATSLDKEVRALTLQKQFLEKDFKDGQQQLSQAKVLWQQILSKLLIGTNLFKEATDATLPGSTPIAMAPSVQESDPLATTDPIVAIAPKYVSTSPEAIPTSVSPIVQGALDSSDPLSSEQMETPAGIADLTSISS